MITLPDWLESYPDQKWSPCRCLVALFLWFQVEKGTERDKTKENRVIARFLTLFTFLRLKRVRVGNTTMFEKPHSLPYTAQKSVHQRKHKETIKHRGRGWFAIRVRVWAFRWLFYFIFFTSPLSDLSSSISPEPVPTTRPWFVVFFSNFFLHDCKRLVGSKENAERESQLAWPHNFFSLPSWSHHWLCFQQLFFFIDLIWCFFIISPSARALFYFWFFFVSFPPHASHDQHTSSDFSFCFTSIIQYGGKLQGRGYRIG